MPLPEALGVLARRVAEPFDEIHGEAAAAVQHRLGRLQSAQPLAEQNGVLGIAQAPCGDPGGAAFALELAPTDPRNQRTASMSFRPASTILEPCPLIAVWTAASGR